MITSLPYRIQLHHSDIFTSRLFLEDFPDFLIYICNPLLPLLLFIDTAISPTIDLTYLPYIIPQNKTVAKHLFIQYSANTSRCLEL